MPVHHDPSARAPAVAGRFYPGHARELAASVERMLGEAEGHVFDGELKGVIAPHAGYVYSGPVAATAYAGLRERADTIERVILLGPAHRVHLRGLALPAASRFATPLGEVEIDAALAERLLALPQVSRSAEAHAFEHSLEVHVPFLQTILPRFTLVPLVVGEASPAAVAEVLELCWGGPETAIVISSDLSHYHRYDEAARLDRETADWIVKARAPGLDPRRACGARCIDGLIAHAQRRPLSLRLLDLRSSGDTAGPRDQVVGYGSFAILEGAPS